MQALGEGFHTVCCPPRALWPGIGPPPAEGGGWGELADDMVAGFTAHGIEGVVGVGHSFGAVATLLAAIRDPAIFRALVLLDPTILPLPQMRLLAEGRIRPALVEGALNRRRQFGSLEEAFAYWRNRALFRDWSDEALRLYAHSTLTATAEGLALRWTPEWEAYYYRSIYTGTWEDLDRLSPTLPLFVLGGSHSTTWQAEAARTLATRAPHAVTEWIEGAGHLFPHTHPAEAADRVRRFLHAVLPAPA